MDAQQLKELKSLQEENRRLKQIYTILNLDHIILKDIIEIKYIQPGRPSQNGYVGRFRTYSEDVLDGHLFGDIEEVNVETERFREEYNMFHPHKQLGRNSPIEYLEEFSKGHAPLKHQFV